MFKIGKHLGTPDKEFLQECCIEDHFESARWAAFVLDLEAVVSEFNSVRLWDYKSFLTIAENRNIIHLHRCAFYSSHLIGNDRKLNVIAFERLERLLFNVAKDIWLEPFYSTSDKLINLKRNVTGLYLLYYLWTTQGQSDHCKILISFTATDQARLGVFSERLETFYPQLPDCVKVAQCILYIIESLKARHAFQFTFRHDEARLCKDHFQLLRIKNLSEVRRTLLSIQANHHHESLLRLLESLCTKMTSILCEAEKASHVPVVMSILLKSFLPDNEIRNCLLFEPDSCKPAMLKLPRNYITIAEQIIQLVQLGFSTIERPFLSLDTLVQLDHVPSKIHALGKVRALTKEQKQSSEQKQYSRRVRAFNEMCIEANRHDKILKDSVRPYREMESYAWDFIHQRLRSTIESPDQQNHTFEMDCIESNVPEPANFIVISDNLALNNDTSQIISWSILS